MFRDIEDLRDCIEEFGEVVKCQHDECPQCGGSMIDSCGFEEYIKLEKYAPGLRFCSEECLEKYLIEEIGIQNENRAQI